MGIESESKGFRVYWQGKNRVSIERDVYFNENEALTNDEVLIEGETDIHTNSNIPQPSQSEINPPSIQNDLNAPEIAPNNTEITENSQPDSATTQPKRPTKRNSLEGLPQFNNEDFSIPLTRSHQMIEDSERQEMTAKDR